MKWKNKYIFYIISATILVADFIWLGIANANVANWFVDNIYQQQLQSITLVENRLAAIFYAIVALFVSMIKE